MALSDEKLEEVRAVADGVVTRPSEFIDRTKQAIPELIDEIKRLTFTLQAIQVHAVNSLPGGSLYSEEAPEFLMDGGLRVIRNYATRALAGEDIRT